ncbi:HIT family protein [Pseudalkalibacillus berkeleyi]|uniref:HIT family protein n=1 Tax=Pseudalkalibacillus berkeleyi TaxID=1069813 RepID=A0ABS9H1B2_9BACL|nr:HIT family protein [Pseudalkalibacillus berkeleyi]MCF6137816.1 HIT family protein [Pseudalkalibacillus berkeleyi]
MGHGEVGRILEMNCLGCHLANQNAPVYVVYEDEFVCCFLDHNPFNEGHILILSKNHYCYFDELDDHSAFSIVKAAKIISSAIRNLYEPDGITICQNGGQFDELTHFHMHIVPRYEGQNFADFYIEDESECTLVDETKLTDAQRKMKQEIYKVTSIRGCNTR